RIGGHVQDGLAEFLGEMADDRSEVMPVLPAFGQEHDAPVGARHRTETPVVAPVAKKCRQSDWTGHARRNRMRLRTAGRAGLVGGGLARGPISVRVGLPRLLAVLRGGLAAPADEILQPVPVSLH